MPESNSTTPAVRAACYFRMSRDDQENSIERQRGQVYPYVARKAYHIAREYKDEGVAGWKSGNDRPDFERMLSDARARLFDVIVCDDVDRFGRFDIHKYGAIVDPLREAGIRLETVAQGLIDWDDTLSQISDAIRMVFKREQSNDTARRILTQFIKDAGEGIFITGTPAYGYVRDKVTGRLALGDPAHVRVVRWLFRTYAERDVSLRWLAAELYASGVRSPGGRDRWTAQSISKLLRNRNYLGDLHWNEVSRGEFQEFNGKDVVKIKRPARGQRKRPEAELIVVPGSHPALIDRETFEVVQAKLAGNKKRTTPWLGGGDFLLCGLLVCGHCGSRMLGRVGWGRHTKRRVYLCSAYQRWGKAGCKCHWVDEQTLLHGADGKKGLIAILERDFLNPAHLAELRQEIRRRAEEAHRKDPAEARRLRGQVADLEGKIRQGNERLAVVAVDMVPGLSETIRGWRAERDRVAKELVSLEHGPAEATAEAEIDRAEKLLWELRRGLESADPRRLRAVLRDLVSNVELWWEDRQAGGFTKSRLSRGLVRLRADPDRLLTCHAIE
jgi:DNA invertase Pin-like site-specific DNA recombinase